MSLARIIAPLLLVSLAGCGGGGGDPVTPTPSPSPSASPSPSPSPTPSPTPTASTRRVISPTVVDGQITTFTQPYIVINAASANAKGKLFVMLPGTGGTPAGYQAVLAEAVARGYHAIGLMYPDDKAVDVECYQSSDQDCAGKLRGEIVTGQPMSDIVTVDPPNSIVGRLTSLLNYLAKLAPDEGWGNFLVNGQPDWSKITMAGHSQGGGHAAYMGKLYSLNRIAMFSSPADVGPAAPDNQARWFSTMANVTPATQMYGFIHDDDPLVLPPRAKVAWTTLGLAGPPTEVDGINPYTGPSHQLTTSVSPNLATAGPDDKPAHGATVTDRFTPRTASGAPQFASVWDYMAFP